MTKAPESLTETPPFELSGSYSVHAETIETRAEILRNTAAIDPR
jgi:hypothetical protein